MRAILRFVGWTLLAAAPMMARGAAAATEKPAARPGLCELRSEGQSIVSLTLDGGAGPFERPGSILRLPAGKYRVSRVILEDGYRCESCLDGPMQRRGDSRQERFFELRPGQPYTLRVGGPLLPTAKASRQGKCVELEYDLLDAEGRSYQKSDSRGPVRPPAPRFVICDGDKEVGTGTFRYG